MMAIMPLTIDTGSCSSHNIEHEGGREGDRGREELSCDAYRLTTIVALMESTRVSTKLANSTKPTQ